MREIQDAVAQIGMKGEQWMERKWCDWKPENVNNLHLCGFFNYQNNCNRAPSFS